MRAERYYRADEDLTAADQKFIRTKTDKMSKSIVIFFSHAGDNYSVGNVEVGNTKIVADYITDIIGADQFEIVTHKYDGMAYTPLTFVYTFQGHQPGRKDRNPVHHP